jgi:RNA recognition motif-containing protein
MKLIIRNIDRSITEPQLKLMFEEYGFVQSCDLVMDKETNESKGFGFVEMPKGGEAKAAMISVNGQKINGTTIRVKKAGR